MPTEDHPWLIDECQPISGGDLNQIRRNLCDDPESSDRAVNATPTLAVCLRDLVVHDNKALFGSADLRLDALVVHGNGNAQDPQSYYTPNTLQFHEIRNGDPLQQRDSNLLVFYGPVRHFLGLSILLSRDTGRTDKLADLLTKQVKSTEFQAASASLMALAAIPQAAAIETAFGAAATIGDLAYKALRQVTGSTIGLYRQSFLQVRDRFGFANARGKVARHPAEGSYRERGFSFAYEIVNETGKSSKTSTSG